MFKNFERLLCHHPPFKNYETLSLNPQLGLACPSKVCRAPATRAHDVTTDLENAMKSELTGLDYITIHIEPETGI